MTYGISGVDILDVLRFFNRQQSDELVLRTHREYWLQTNQSDTEIFIHLSHSRFTFNADSVLLQAWCYLQVKLCDPRLSALSVPPWPKKRYINTLPFLFSFYWDSSK